MNRKKLIILSVVILVAVVIAGGFMLIRAGDIDASELTFRGKLIRQNFIDRDLNNDGKFEKIYLSIYQKDNIKKSYISIRDGIGKKREKMLSGFEDDLVICPNGIKPQNEENLICIFGEVGVHSQNIQFLRYRDLSTVNFIEKDGSIRKSMTCDVPYFDIKTDNNLEIYFDNRNYEKDPLVDINRIHYYFNNDSFIYKNIEQLSQEGNIK